MKCRQTDMKAIVWGAGRIAKDSMDFRRGVVYADKA